MRCAKWAAPSRLSFFDGERQHAVIDERVNDSRLAYWLKRCARRGSWRLEEGRFSAHRSQGNCASSKAMASAVVCPGAALSAQNFPARGSGHRPPCSPQANAAPPLPAIPVTRLGDLWVCGTHRVLCGDATSEEAVRRLLGASQPILLVSDPPYGIELDSEWRDRAGLNGCGPAEASYMKPRTAGHTHTSISSDTRADWSAAFELVPGLQATYVWHASVFTREVLNGLLRIGFLYPQQIIWNKGRIVLTRTHYWYQHEPCWYVRKKNAPWFGKAGENSTIWDSPSPKFIMGGSDETKFDHPTQKPISLMQRPIRNHTRRGELVYDPFLGSGTTLAAAEQTGRVCHGLELDPKYVDVVVERWQALTGRRAVLDGDGRVFAEVRHERLAADGAACQPVVSC